MPSATDPLDTQPLRVLTTTPLAERSLSRSSIKLDQSQLVFSTALKRLRESFKDPLVSLDKGLADSDRARSTGRSRPVRRSSASTACSPTTST